MSKLLVSCLLIIGTSIGVGMLGLPVEMGQGGSLPSAIFLCLTWLMALLTGLLFTEIVSSMNRSENFAGLANSFFGVRSKYFVVVTYLLLFLSLIFAYVKGGGVFITDLFPSIPAWLGTAVFLGVLGPFVLRGTKLVGKLNVFLVLVMFASLACILFLGVDHLDGDLLRRKNWKSSFLSFPLLITAFGFHIIIPSLYEYLGRNKKQLRYAILIGTTVTMVIYLSWNILIMGLVPLEGPLSLTAALYHDETAISPLKRIVQSRNLSVLAQVFYFSALITSFLGVSLSMIDFSVDALGIKKTKKNRNLISLFLFVPAFLVASTKLRVFYLSIKYGAALACVALLIVFPAILYLKIKKNSIFALLALIFAALVIFAQISNFLL